MSAASNRAQQTIAIVLDRVRANPGLKSFDLPPGQRNALKALEMANLIEYREGAGWFPRSP